MCERCDRPPAAVYAKGSRPPARACTHCVWMSHTSGVFVSGGTELRRLTGGPGGRLLTVAPRTWSSFYGDVCAPGPFPASQPWPAVGSLHRAWLAPVRPAATIPDELGSAPVSRRWKHMSSIRHHTSSALSSHVEPERTREFRPSRAPCPHVSPGHSLCVCLLHQPTYA